MSKTRRWKTRPNASKFRASNHEKVRSQENPRFSLILVGFISCLHICGVAALFSPLAGIVNTQPLIDQDWGLHFHHLNSLAAFWSQDHALWGYNPFFMAGYPSNTIQDLSIKFFEFAAVGLSFTTLSPVQWFKICGFLATASLPWMIYFAARNFFTANASGSFTAALTAFIGTVYWWNSLPREMFFYGMIGFPLASYLSVLGLSLFYRMTEEPAKCGIIHLGWLLFSAVIPSLHVQSVVILLPPMIALLAARAHVMTARRIIWVAGAAALSLAVNFAWLVPAFNHRGDDVSKALTEQLPLFVSADPLIFLKDFLSTVNYWSFRPAAWEKGFRLALLICGAWGIRKMLHGEKRDLGILLTAGTAVLFVISYFGSFVPFIKPWQPLRFKVPLDLLLAVGAAHSLAEWQRTPKSARGRFIPFAAALGLAAFFINITQTEAAGRLQLRSRFIQELNEIVDWIKRETPPNARLLFEESGDESGFVYDRTYLSSFLPYLTGRQLIGGPINLYNDRHHFAEFHSGKLFQKEVQTISDSELRDYLRLYNISAIVAFDPRSVGRLQSVQRVITVEQRIGPIYLMKVNQPLSWFLAGEGEVKAGYNRLELSNLKGDELILKYHWVDGLTAEPPARIEPVKVADDPIPFIKLIHPPPALTMRVASP